MALRRWDQSPLYFCCFLLTLFGLQGVSLARQFQFGFRLFGTPPVRVLFSWDMFATRTERCELCWDPPLQLKGFGSVSCLKDLSQPFEWEIVFDQKGHYEWAGHHGCLLESWGVPSGHRETPQPHTVNLQCFTLEGRVEESSFLCASTWAPATVRGESRE